MPRPILLATALFAVVISGVFLHAHAAQPRHNPLSIYEGLLGSSVEQLTLTTCTQYDLYGETVTLFRTGETSSVYLFCTLDDSSLAGVRLTGSGGIIRQATFYPHPGAVVLGDLVDWYGRWQRQWGRRAWRTLIWESSVTATGKIVGWRLGMSTALDSVTLRLPRI